MQFIDLIGFLVLTLLILVYWLNPKHLMKRAKPQNKWLANAFINATKAFPVTKRVAFISLTAVISTVLIEFAFFLTGKNVVPFQNHLVSAIVFHPIVEEFAFRGFFLGFLLNVSEKLIVNEKKKQLVFALLVLFNLFYFTSGHSSALIYFNTIVFVAAYLCSNKNLLPSILAHSTLNLIVFLWANHWIFG
jgi:membrane protease YdiL (CAAX protease family)